MSLSVDSDVDRSMDLCWDSSLLSLELEDDWSLVWKEISVCYIVVVPAKERFFSCWLEQ